VPTLLVHNPYGEQSGRSLPVVPALEAGFALVIQHCRGRGSSDGEFSPWVDEPADGADTVAWITAQPWSNGKVAGWGLSYTAGTALRTAIDGPAGYVGMVAMMTPADFYDDLNYVGGALALGSARFWATL
jgi:putative CocE/NonD family hydrolase